MRQDFWTLYRTVGETNCPGGTASTIAFLTGVPLHHVLGGSEVSARRTEIMGRASGWIARGQRRGRATDMASMRCRYSNWEQVSSEKHETAAEAGVDDEV